MDRSYFLQELRTKITEMSVEINKMDKEIEAFEQVLNSPSFSPLWPSLQENAQAVQLERQKSAITQQVEELRRNLAEYNLLIEKLRTSTDLQLDQIVQDRKQLKGANDTQKKSIDAIFTERIT